MRHAVVSLIGTDRSHFSIESWHDQSVSAVAGVATGLLGATGGNVGIATVCVVRRATSGTNGLAMNAAGAIANLNQKTPTRRLPAKPDDIDGTT